MLKNVSLAFHELSIWDILCLSEGVVEDASKLEAMNNWLTPTIIKSLRGFLGLTRYYRKFVANYGSIAFPLIQLLNKGQFSWNSGAEEAFQCLKSAMLSVLVLGLQDFSQPIIIET